MENTLTSKRDELSNRIAAAPVGQDVSSLLAARNWYNRAIAQTALNLPGSEQEQDPNWCYVCDRPAYDCACELDPNGPLGAYSEGNVGRHTTLRLDSFVDAVAGKRLTYKRLIA